MSSVFCDVRWRPLSVVDADGGEARFAYGADGTWVEYARSDGGSVTSITSVALFDAANETRTIVAAAARQFSRHSV